MHRVVFILLAGMFAIGVGGVQAENEIAIESMPPVVVKTFPQAGDTAVDPSIKEIRVTFSKDMMTKEIRYYIIVEK